jgi:hypothetical protein
MPTAEEKKAADTEKKAAADLKEIQDATKVSHAKSLGEKQYSTSLTVLPKLAVCGYEEFKASLERIAYQNDWPQWLLDKEIAMPTANRLTTKEIIDNKNAYALVMDKAKGHLVYKTLEPPAVALGDAKLAYYKLDQYFNRTSIAGRGKATREFYTITMENTATNIVQWLALVPQRRIKLLSAGGTATESDSLNQMLIGLLVEFNQISTNLQARDVGTLTYADAEPLLLDYATANNLTEFTKGGKQAGKANIFSIDDKSKNQPRKERDPNRPPLTVDQISKKQCFHWKRNKGCTRNPCMYAHGDKLGQGYPDGTPPQNKPSVNMADARQQPSSESKELAASLSAMQADLASLKSQKAEAEIDTPTVHMNASIPGSEYAEYHSFSLEEIQGRQPDTEQDDAPPDTIAVPRKWIPTLFMLLCSALCVLGSAISTCWSMAVRSWSALTMLPDAASSVAMSTPGRYVTTGVLLLALCMMVQPVSTDRINDQCFNQTSGQQHAQLQGYEWCSDSGTNRFVTNDVRDFVPGSVRTVSTTVANGGGKTNVTKSGTVIIKGLDFNHILYCKDVLYMPSCAKKLMPASSFVKKGCELSYKDDVVKLSTPQGKPMLKGKEVGGLFFFHAKTLYSPKLNKSKKVEEKIDSSDSTFFGLQAGANISTAAQDFSSRLLEAHWCYGHLHFDKLRKLLNLPKGTNPACAACTIALSKRMSMGDKPFTRSTRPCHRMHMDLGFTKNSQFCFQLCIDDYDRTGYLDVLENKSEALAKWIDLKNHMETDSFPHKFAIVKSDCERLYNTPAWKAHLAEFGIEHEFSNRYRHDQLGVAERAMQTVGTSFRCMMFQGCAPESDIPDCLNFANVIRNHSPTAVNGGWSPVEKKAGMKLAVNKRLLRGPLFCLCFAHVYEEERPKHAARGIASVYLGYDPTNNAFLVKEWVSGARYYTADVTMHPRTFPYRANPNRSIGSLGQYDDLAPHVTVPLERTTAPLRIKSTRIHDILNSGDKLISDIPDEDSPPESADSDALVNFVHSFGPDPETMTEALTMFDANEWIAARLTERTSLQQHNVYDAVLRSEVPYRTRVFNPKEVLKR